LPERGRRDQGGVYDRKEEKDTVESRWLALFARDLSLDSGSRGEIRRGIVVDLVAVFEGKVRGNGGESEGKRRASSWRPKGYGVGAGKWETVRGSRLVTAPRLKEDLTGGVGLSV
jgi:hypothetical protein